MIQYINSISYPTQTYSQWEFIQELSPYSDWKIKKFADKLKDIVCMLIGCTRGQLENREFKEKELGEEWWYYKYSDSLIPFKNMEEFESVRLLKGGHCVLIKLTPRLLLQLLGTNCGRKIIHPNIWVNALFSDYKIIGLNPYDNQVPGIDYYYPNWIITDVRFQNEVEAIKKRGGIVIRVDRPCKECGGMGYHKMDCNVGRCEHESEYALDSYEGFDYLIENDGTINELLEKVKAIL